MLIRNENTATRRFYDDELMGDHYDRPGPEWELSENGDFRYRDIKKPVGEALVQSDDHPLISVHEDEVGASDAESTETETETETDDDQNHNETEA